jgi:D-amino-acid dehydrogenase
MTERVDAIVIGGGITGAGSAYYLAERGARVALLERGELCSARRTETRAGSSQSRHSAARAGRNPPGAALAVRSGVLLRAAIEPARALLLRFARRRVSARDVALNRELASLALCAELEARPGVDFGFSRRGLLVLCESGAGLDAAHHELEVLRGLGGEGSALSPADVAKLAPRVTGPIAGGVLFPVDAHVQPARLVAALAGLATSRARSSPATTCSLRARGRRISRVRTTRGEFRAARSSSRAARGRRGSCVRSACGCRCRARRATASPFGVRGLRRDPLMLSETKVFVTPMGALRFGGTLELAGLDLSVNLRRVRAVERAIARVLPGVEKSEHVETWRGLRPLTPDDRPILGRPRAFENLVVATGHGMSGISQGVISGKLVSELVAGARPSLDLAAFSPDRFA